MKYILNEIPVKTTNSFNINDLNIDLCVPTNRNFHKFSVSNNDIDIKYGMLDSLSSKIGLNVDNALKVDINIDKDYGDIIELIYDFGDDDALVSNVCINISEGCSTNIVFKYISSTDTANFHYLRQIVNVGKNSKVNITNINLLNDKSTSLIAVENNIENSGTITNNLIDIGGCVKISNYYSICLDNSKCFINTIYSGKNSDIIDTNYYCMNKGINSISNINTEGLLDDNSNKKYRATIDFISGCSNADGKIFENVLLLSDKCISKSAPILLCGEENVTGSHSVSSTKVSEDKLFYLMSRGNSVDISKKMIILSNFNKIIGNINNKKIEDEVLNILTNKY